MAVTSNSPDPHLDTKAHQSQWLPEVLLVELCGLNPKTGFRREKGVISHCQDLIFPLTFQEATKLTLF